jgi:hypothetical protein
MVDTINQFIPSQFPLFYKDKGPVFISFLKAYYEWLEQEGNPIWYARNFKNIIDIDNTLDQFIIHFQNEYMNNLPTTMVTNQRLLIKHITDLYNAKGSKRGYELLFRILFNEDIQYYLPGQFIFKTSDNEWVEGGYIEVSGSPYLANLIGLPIYSSGAGSTALVEDFNIITINNKVVNVLHLSNINGNFGYGEQILSRSLPALTTNNAPSVVGSLSSVSIENGGVFFNLGDVVNIIGTGAGGLGRVSSITSENGKTVFNLVDGGAGFTLNAQVIVSGGGGSGATFSVGEITDQSVISVNTDTINNYYNTQLDIYAEGFKLGISGTVGTFTVGEVINSHANGIALDFAYLTGNNLLVGESLSNTSLGISGLVSIVVDNPNFVNCTGPEATLNNANIVSGVVLISNTTGSVLYINSVLPKTQYIANGIVQTTNSTIINVANANGYFLPTSKIYGQSSLANATVTTTTRLTNWGFPVAGNTNLDSPINSVLTYENLVIGTISRLIKENPGVNYTSNATVTITEPLVYQMQLPDGRGGYLGGDANVTASAINANGIITSIEIIDSGFGFTPDEPLALYSNNNFAATGYAVVDGTGVSPGYWNSNKSFLSDEIYLQDSYYYQDFSYEILAPRVLESYDKFVKDILHPVGYQLFGKLKIIDSQVVESNLSATSTSVYTNGTLTQTE